MLKQNLARGLVLAGIALAFGLTATRLPIGSLSRAGPGMFPLMVSGGLLALALLMIAKSFVEEAPAFGFNVKNIAVIMAGLAGFVLLSRHVTMVLGIAWLVFVSTLAGTSYSWKRNLQVTVGLILVALAFQKLLGLNLRLI